MSRARPRAALLGNCGVTLMILITGATGSNDTELVKLLSSRGVTVRAMIRSRQGRVYDLTGPEALTHAEMAARLSEAVGRPITFVDIPPAAMQDALLGAGFPRWQAEGLLEDYAHYRRDEASAVRPGVQQATGKPARSFSDFAQDYASAFS